MVASLGSLLGRACDGEPRNRSRWLGLQRLDGITHMFRLPPHRPVFSDDPG